MCALVEDGVGNTDTIRGWRASAHTLKDRATATQLHAGCVEQTEVKGLCGCR